MAWFEKMRQIQSNVVASMSEGLIFLDFDGTIWYVNAMAASMLGMSEESMIVGNIGSEKRMKYGIVGSHVNLCGRIESYTAGSQILISPGVRSRVSVPLEIEKEMTVLPKGMDEEIILSQVTGIGAPYDIHITVESNLPKKLKEPIPICFYRIDGKHTTEKVCYGGIAALGSDCAILETETGLELYDNLQIHAGGKLLCKVMEKNDQEFLVRYTSIPSGYEKWIGEQRKF